MKLEDVERLRRRLHVHSILYYHLDSPILSDAAFDKLANQLVEANKNYPEFLHKGYRHTMFEDWTGDTGMHLIITDEMLSLANWLLKQMEAGRRVS